MNRRLWALSFGLVIGLVVLVGGRAAATATGPQQQSASASPAIQMTGTLNIVAGDRSNFSGAPVEWVTLVPADGRETTLILDRNLYGRLDIYRLTGQLVTVTGAPVDSGNSGTSANEGLLKVSELEPVGVGRPAQTAVSGNTKWVSIGCKFADIADEPRPLSYFQTMYANTYPGLDAYWREASYDAINLLGSTAVDWVTLPKPMSAYQIDDTNLRLTDILMDCAAQADAQVDFTQYKGINLMLNGEPGCCAWGGNRTVTLDGVSRTWSVTWLPVWAYIDQGYVQHEMTHAYGILWHSYANDNPYGDPWDVVSNARAYYGDNGHPVYGDIGQHTQAYHRHYLGWLPEARILTVTGAESTFTLERTTQPGPTGYLMARVPIDGSADHYYALEARQLVGFDGHLLGNSIDIHEIGGSRHSVQLMDPYAIGTPYGGHVWKIGQVWAAPEGGIAVHVDAATAGGFKLTVQTELAAKSLSLSPTADTYIDAEMAEANFGTGPILRTRTALDFTGTFGKATFLRFDPQSLPDHIVHARLRLTLAQGTITGHLPRVTWSSFDPQWQETSLTWSSAAASYVGWYSPEVFAPTAQGTNWLEWDVAGILTVRGPQSLASLVVDNGEFTFSSKESTGPPQLIIDYLVPTDDDSLTLLPTNDAYVREANPSTVYGSASILAVSHQTKEQNSYVKFNINALPAPMIAATLRLYVTEAGPGGVGLYVVSPYYQGTTTQWLETGLKWSNAPAIAGEPFAPVNSLVDDKWQEVDVTAAALDAIATQNGRLSLGLRTDSTGNVSFSSKEGTHPPELVIHFDGELPTPTATAPAAASPSPSPTNTLTPGPTATSTGTATTGPSPTTTATVSSSPTWTPGSSPTPTATGTRGPSPTPTATLSPINTATPGLSPTPAAPIYGAWLPFIVR